MFKSLIFFLTVFLIFSSACSESSDSQNNSGAAKRAIPAEFRDQYTGAVKVYLEMKDALVRARDDMAIEKAQELKTALQKINDDNLPDDQKKRWQKDRQSLLDQLDEMIASEDLMDQRTAFLPVSETLIASLRNVGPLDINLFVQHCPMAFDNEGGDWLSDSEKIYNPYFGQMMLHCGWVEDSLLANAKP